MVHFTPQKKNLLITTVGNRALQICNGWLEGERNFDSVLIFYDLIGSELFNGLSDYIILKTGFKYPSLLDIFHKYPELLNSYEYFFLPDDDLKITTEDINSLFDFVRKNKLVLCQPSLSPVNAFWQITWHNPFTEYRLVKMVEVMCPLFSKDALIACLPTFSETQSGWGLEPVWSKLLGNPINCIAVYDKVVASHSTPSNTKDGHLYNALKKQGIDHDHELDYMLKKYDVRLDFTEIECIYKEGLSKMLSELLIPAFKQTIDEEEKLTYAFYMHMGLIKVLLSDYFLKLYEVLKLYEDSHHGSIIQIDLYAIKSFFDSNKDELLEITSTILKTDGPECYDYPLWFNEWLNLCRTETIKKVTSNSHWTEFSEFQICMTYAINKHLKMDRRLQLIVDYFIRNVFNYLHW